MKHLLLAGASALALAMAGCASNPTGTGSTTTTPDIGVVIADARQAAALLCAITPTAEAITNILTATGSAGTQSTSAEAQAAANVFCNGVTGTTAPTSTVKLRRSVRRMVAATPAGTPIYDYGSIVIDGVTVDLTGSPAK